MATKTKTAVQKAKENSKRVSDAAPQIFNCFDKTIEAIEKEFDSNKEFNTLICNLVETFQAGKVDKFTTLAQQFMTTDFSFTKTAKEEWLNYVPHFPSNHRYVTSDKSVPNNKLKKCEAVGCNKGAWPKSNCEFFIMTGGCLGQAASCSALYAVAKTFKNSRNARYRSMKIAMALAMLK